MSVRDRNSPLVMSWMRALVCLLATGSPWLTAKAGLVLTFESGSKAEAFLATLQRQQGNHSDNRRDIICRMEQYGSAEAKHDPRIPPKPRADD